MRRHDNGDGRILATLPTSPFEGHASRVWVRRVARQRVKDGGLPAGKALEPTPAPERSAQAEAMIEAHEALVEADPGNLTKFKDVLEYLKQDLHRAD